MDQNFNEKLSSYLNDERERLVKKWMELVALPSVSSTGEGIDECCRFVMENMISIGIETKIHSIKPYPVIVGQCGTDPEKKTILIYAHYDVQPVGNTDLWESEPFTPVVRNGIVYGRGAADNKSPLMAHLMATEFLLRHYGETLPVNLKFIFEGCEELGSSGLKEFLIENRELLSADFVFFSDGSMNEKNIPILALGAKGCLHVTLELRTLKQDAHSRFAPVLPSAAWQMVELLNYLKNGDKVLIPGFYDGIINSTAVEMEIMRSLPPVDDEMTKIYGAVPEYPEDEGYYVHLNTTPTFNISRISSGAGAGVVTSTATAQLDIRLVMGQQPEDVFEKLRRYIASLGYTNVILRRGSAVEPSKTPLDNPYVKIVERVTREVYGDCVTYPCRPSTAPDYLWTSVLGLPAIQVRWSDADSNNHAPNEHQSIEGYVRGVELTCRVVHALEEYTA